MYHRLVLWFTNHVCCRPNLTHHQCRNDCGDLTFRPPVQGHTAKTPFPTTYRLTFSLFSLASMNWFLQRARPLLVAVNWPNKSVNQSRNIDVACAPSPRRKVQVGPSKLISKNFLPGLSYSCPSLVLFSATIKHSHRPLFGENFCLESAIKSSPSLDRRPNSLSRASWAAASMCCID